MSRLFNALYRALFGLHVKSAEQHVIDLERILSSLLERRERLHLDIEHTQKTLDVARDAYERRKARLAGDHRGQPAPQGHQP